MTVAILGQQDDIHVELIANQLNDYIIIDDLALLQDIEITHTSEQTSLEIDECSFSISSVYWRNLDIYPFSYKGSEIRDELAYMKLFIDCFKHARWVNSPSSFFQHFLKYNQFDKVANTTTALVPQTIITNNGQSADNFIKQHGVVAVKPVVGGDYTQKISSFDEWSSVGQPLIFQKFIDGQNLRTFVIGNDVFTAEMRSDLVDFRTDDNCTIVPVKLPYKQHQLALDITRTLGYEWTAIDWIKADDKYYFLEANFSPMFAFFEEQTHYPIAKSLVNLLIQ